MSYIAQEIVCCTDTQEKNGTTLFQETVVQGNFFLSSAIMMAKQILSIVKKRNKDVLILGKVLQVV